MPQSVVDSLVGLNNQNMIPNDTTPVVIKDKTWSVEQGREDAKLDGTITIVCDFSNQEELKKQLSPFLDSCIGIISRGEGNVVYLQKLIPFFNGLDLPTVESLKASTSKLLMRRKFAEYDSSVSPNFELFESFDEQRIVSAGREIGYPVVIKPANLASSLLVQECSNEKELVAAMRHAFDKIESLYSKMTRSEKPTMIIEEMLIGDLFSVDPYINAEGKMYWVPIVGYVTGKSIGIDDFFLYRRTNNIELSVKDVDEARRVSESGCRALGLVSSSAHIELIRTKKGWKIIEIGPRLGRFRIDMYRYGYDIDHSTNDIAIRVGLKPIVNEQRGALCSAYSIYPENEGRITDIEGLDNLQQLESLKSLTVNMEIGETSSFAKNGGKSVLEFIVANSDEQQFAQDTAYIEENVRVNTSTLNID